MNIFIILYIVDSFKSSENKDLDAYLNDKFFKLSDFLFKCHNRSFSQN